MTETKIIQVTPNELVQLINEGIKAQLQKFTIDIQSKELDNKPHLTRKETAKFFDVSLNCINDWSKKGILQPFKVGQRTFFRKSDLLQVMFNQKTA